MRIERDRALVLSGVRHGLTIGSPISMLINNLDWENWSEEMSVESVEADFEPATRPRPGHADLTGTLGRAPRFAAAPLRLDLRLSAKPELRPTLEQAGVRLDRRGSARRRITGTPSRPVVR